MKNTRFYPTLNGECHLGHLFIALVNYHHAKNNNGAFIVRFEIEPWYLVEYHATECLMAMWRDSFKKTFDLVGIEAEYMPLLHDAQWVDEKLKEHVSLHDDYESTHGFEHILSLIPQCPSITAHAYYPTHCLMRVLLDNHYGVGEVIRGMDMLSENSLYIHYCKQLNLPVPQMSYCPLMQLKEGTNVRTVSKKHNNGKLSKLGDLSKDNLMQLLSSCLEDPAKGFVISNIKENPVLHLV